MTQSVELMPQSVQAGAGAVQRSSDEAVDSPRSYVPLMSQDHVPSTRYVDMSAATDNHITRQSSQPELSTTEAAAPSHTTTHSQLISIV